MAVDTEDITTENITINGMDGIIYSKRGLTTIIVKLYPVNGKQT